MSPLKKSLRLFVARTFPEQVTTINIHMIRRHPHIFISMYKGKRAPCGANNDVKYKLYKTREKIQTSIAKTFVCIYWLSKKGYVEYGHEFVIRLRTASSRPLQTNTKCLYSFSKLDFLLHIESHKNWFIFCPMWRNSWMDFAVSQLRQVDSPSGSRSPNIGLNAVEAKVAY